MNYRIHFEGSFIEYFLMAVGLVVVCFLTFGLALPYYFYWSLKYFFTKLRIGDQKIAFTGNFGEYFLTALGLLVVSVITLGLALPYYGYWTFKYFFAHLELQSAPGTTYSHAGRSQTSIAAAPPVDALPMVEPVAPPTPDVTASENVRPEPLVTAVPAPKAPRKSGEPKTYRFGS